MLQVVPHSLKKTSAISIGTKNRADDIPRAALIHQRSGARNRILVSAKIFDRFGGGATISSVIGGDGAILMLFVFSRNMWLTVNACC